MSESFEKFINSVNNRTMDWIDGFDLEAFQQLSDDEKHQAIKIIVEALDKNDLRAARAAARIADQNLTVALNDRFHSFEGEMKIETAMALHELGSKNPMDSEIAEVLETGDADERRTAAHYLRSFPTSSARNALFRAIENDKSPGVRQTAAISLMLMTGDMENELDFRRRELLLRLSGDNHDERISALRELNFSACQTEPPENVLEATQASSFCSNCGKKIPAKVKFCRFCGGKL